jgi:hypothetical protein
MPTYLWIKYSNHRNPARWLEPDFPPILARNIEGSQLYGTWRETRPNEAIPTTAFKRLNRPQRESRIRYLDEEIKDARETFRFGRLSFFAVRLKNEWPYCKKFLVIDAC